MNPQQTSDCPWLHGMREFLLREGSGSHCEKAEDCPVSVPGLPLVILTRTSDAALCLHTKRLLAGSARVPISSKAIIRESTRGLLTARHHCARFSRSIGCASALFKSGQR